MMLGLGGCVRGRKATKKLAMFSKQWSPGDTLHTFYRVYRDNDTDMFDYVAGAQWGYPVGNIKELGLKTTFIPALCKFDADGKPVGKPDILYRFSRFAPSLVKAAHEAEIRAASNKPGVTESMLRDVIRDIDNKYDTKNNMEAIRPIIGRPTSLIVIEALVVPYKEGVPVTDSLVVAMQPISDSVGDRLGTILANPLFHDVEDDWIEVEWAFPMDTNKAQSGRKVVPTGVTAEYRIKNQFPNAWDAVQQAMSGMSSDSEMIIRRSTNAVSEQRIINALSRYLILNSDALNACGASDDILEGIESTISVIHELSMDNIVTDPKVKEILEKAVSVDVDTSDTVIPTANDMQPTAPVVTPSGVTAPSIDQLISQVDSVAQDTEQFLQNIDLGAISAEE